MIVRYSVIRFMPFAETQEFANVGVIAHSPDTGIVEFKLAASRNKRVSAFFDDMDGALYTKAMAAFKTELTRVKNLASEMNGKALAYFMDEVTRPRQGFLTYSQTSTMFANEDIATVVNRLYETYVARAFNTREHREAILLKMVKQSVSHAAGKLYRKDTLGSGALEFELPLVAKTTDYTKAIKPLAFHHKDPMAMFDHGSTWISRVKYLLNIEAISPEHFLFVVDSPSSLNKDLSEAFWSISNQMKMLDVNVYQHTQMEEIAAFARNTAGVNATQIHYRH